MMGARLGWVLVVLGLVVLGWVLWGAHPSSPVIIPR